MDNFDVQDYESHSFVSSWNTKILEGDDQVLGENASSFFDETGAPIVIDSPTDIANLLNCSQDLYPLDLDENLPPDFLNIIKNEVVETENNVSTTSFVSRPASLPASSNWPGENDFKISFTPHEKKTKGVSWVYNESKKMLFVAKEAPCPINFATNCMMPPNVYVRVMALYSSPESASEVVERCIQHRGEDEARGIEQAEHLVRCESSMASYEVDQTTKRYSVVIPFENPPPGQSFSTYIFKFKCFGSCPGPNRRPLMLVFSLEQDNQVIGRQKVDVKICACPGRDSKSEKSEQGTSKKRKVVEPETSKATPAKKSKMAPEGREYNISVGNDRKCFEFLTQMKKYYYIIQTMNNMTPDVKNLIDKYNKRKGYPPSSGLL